MTLQNLGFHKYAEERTRLDNAGRGALAGLTGAQLGTMLGIALTTGSGLKKIGLGPMGRLAFYGGLAAPIGVLGGFGGAAIGSAFPVKN